MCTQPGKVTSLLSLVACVTGAGLLNAVPALADETTVINQSFSTATNLGLYGGQPEDIASDPNSDAVYFAAFNPSAIFSSTDLGDNWFGLPSDTNYGTGKAVEVDPDTGTVYALVGDSVIKSDDQGTTWDDLTSGMGAPILGEVMLFAHGRLMVAQTTSDLSVSTDLGATWDAYTVDASGEVSYLAAATTGEVYYAVTTDGTTDTLWTSTDGGVTWTDLNVYARGLASGNRFYEVSVDPLDDDHLVLTSHIGADFAYQSFDAGTTWTAMTNQDGERVSGTHGTFDGDGRLYIGSNYTSDASATPMQWDGLTVSTPSSSVYADTFAVDPEDSNILFTNTVYGVARSEDRGVSWTDQVTGVSAVKVYDIAQSADKSVVWIGANGGLAKTENFTDASPTWEYPILPASNINNVQAVWVKPANPDVVVMGGSGLIYYTTDGGTSWTQSSSPSFSGRVQDIIQSPVDASRLYAIFFNDDLSAVDTGGVFMSEDNGETWTDLSLTDNLPAASLAVTQDDTVYVGIGGDAEATGIYTYDGSTWDLLTDSPQTQKITSLLADPSDADTVYTTIENNFTGTGAFYYTNDAGNNWTRVTDGLTEVSNLDTLTLQAGTSTMYVAGQSTASLNGVIYKSTDQGLSWSEYYTGLKQEGFHTMLFDGLMVGNDQGLFGLQSKARLKLRANDSSIKSGSTLTLTATLKDKATGLKLEGRKLKIYKKVKSGDWRLVDRKTTNSKGQVHLQFSPTKKTHYKLRWVPKGDDAADYAKVTSKVVDVTVN